MFVCSRTSLRSTTLICFSRVPILARKVTTQTRPCKEEGDISSVFVSLSGVVPEPLPERFADIKRQLIRGNEAQIATSWQRLLRQLVVENETVKQKGSEIIPQIQFKDLGNVPQEFLTEVRKRGVAVIRGVIPENEARDYKTEIEDYVKLNPQTKGTTDLFFK